MWIDIAKCSSAAIATTNATRIHEYLWNKELGHKEKQESDFLKKFIYFIYLSLAAVGLLLCAGFL